MDASSAMRRFPFDGETMKMVEAMRGDAICIQDEALANDCWYLARVLEAHALFQDMFSALRAERYRDAWNMLDDTDIMLSLMELNYGPPDEQDNLRLAFIGRMVHEYQKLFPYKHFFSIETIVKAEKCSICGKSVSLRNPCGHEPGRLYMGKTCSRIITKCSIRGVSVVTDPYDRKCVIDISGHQWDYGALDAVVNRLTGPYDGFTVARSEVAAHDGHASRREIHCDICLDPVGTHSGLPNTIRLPFHELLHDLASGEWRKALRCGAGDLDAARAIWMRPNL